MNTEKPFIAFVLVLLMAACGQPAVKSALEAIREPAIEVLTNVINDRLDSMVDEDTAVCWELPEGWRSGEEELDDDERGAFIVCWARAAD